MLLPESFGLDGEYDIVSCNKCGCCYADVSAAEKDYDNYYRNHNCYGGWQANSTGKADIDVVMRSICQLANKDAKIVDVGFGNGRLLGELKKEGFMDENIS